MAALPTFSHTGHRFWGPGALPPVCGVLTTRNIRPPKPAVGGCSLDRRGPDELVAFGSHKGMGQVVDRHPIDGLRGESGRHPRGDVARRARAR